MKEDSKKILLLTPHFYPELISTGKFNTELALALQKQEHKISVLCYHPLYPEWQIQPSEEQLKGIRIKRMGRSVKFPNNQFLRRLVLEVSFALNTALHIRKIAKRVDYVLPIFPPSLAFFLIKGFLPQKTKTVGIIHDLQQIHLQQKTGLIHKILSVVINTVERKSFRSCNRLIFLSREMRDKASELYYLRKENTLVQYPFITLNEKFEIGAIKVLDPNKINITYSGALGEKQNPVKLYEFFNYASDKLENAEFHIFSKGNIFSQLKGMNTNAKIKFHELVPNKNLGALYKQSEVQIVPQKEGTSSGSLPSKLPNLLISGVKTLLITDPGSELYHFYKNNDLSEVATSWDYSVLLKALEKIIKVEIDVDNQKVVAKKFFTIDKMIEKILE